MRVSLNLNGSNSKDVAIMVDALRASATITTALQSFKSVIPVKEIHEAVHLADKHKYILAGEREGAKIEGFDVGNSPVDIRNFQGDVLVLTTSNGTRILENISASTILIGSFLNAHAVASKASELAKNHVEVVMAGVKDEFVIEDFLAAGEIISYLQDHELDEEALAAVLASTDPEKVDVAVLESNSALRLLDLGLRKDIKFSLMRNIYNTVPLYKDGVIKKFESFK
ncbi:MAG TPA: 2-phosphosulfolactate phosphatase [Methanobacterium sp.]|jgi:2-phosphosulfolactate phosphatase|nr:MAG: 2-phosphosulfolactate phosphatase [Methanobacterium sp.]HOI72483.1 2-phosphosulfolactate phosphatase [Methanobacterium sp.]HPX77635.1 2-phosphosulfolactate phosphatase [Methanobacterium sp.]